MARPSFWALRFLVGVAECMCVCMCLCVWVYVRVCVYVFLSSFACVVGCVARWSSVFAAVCGFALTCSSERCGFEAVVQSPSPRQERRPLVLLDW